MTAAKVTLTDAERWDLSTALRPPVKWQNSVTVQTFMDEADARTLLDETLGTTVESIVAARVAEARAEVLREYANEQHALMAQAWGGDRSWLTSGTKVANVVRDWILEDANECAPKAVKS